MEEKDLFNTTFNMSECSDINHVFSILDQMKNDFKLRYKYDSSNETITLIDDGLSEDEIESITSLFEDYDVLEDEEIFEDDEDDFYDSDEYDY